MRKVRILFLPGVDSDNTNAQSLNAREIALRLDPGRIESTLFYEQQPDPRLVQRPGVSLLRLPSRGKTWRIFREMRAGHDLIAYMDYSPASYLFLHLPRILRSHTKAVFHAEAPVTQLVNPSLGLRFLYRGTFPRADVYTGITKFVARDVSHAANKKVNFILPVGVDTKLFAPPLARSNSAPVVLFAGTLIERKGPQFVVDAAAHFPHARFRIVGAGRKGFEQVLRQKIQDLGLRNVTLEGAKSQPQMIDIMRESDIFLLPSRLEGIPKVTLEAAAAGLPCVVFRDYQTPSVVDEVTGFQVGTLDEMMRALENLMHDSALRNRMGRAARQHVEQFDWEIVSALWQRTYLEISADRAQ